MGHLIEPTGKKRVPQAISASKREACQMDRGSPFSIFLGHHWLPELLVDAVVVASCFRLMSFHG